MNTQVTQIPCDVTSLSQRLAKWSPQPRQPKKNGNYSKSQLKLQAITQEEKSERKKNFIEAPRERAKERKKSY